MSQFRSRGISCAAAAGVALSVSVCAGQVTTRTIALSGGVAPGTGGGLYASFYNPSMNPEGQVVFSGLLAVGNGVTSSDNSFIYVDTDGSLSLLARENEVAGGAGGAQFSAFTFPAIYQGGAVLVSTTLRGAGTTSATLWGLFLADGGPLQLVARQGSAAPETGGALFGAFNTGPDGNAPGTVNSAGTVMFNNILTTTGAVTGANNDVLYKYTVAPDLIARGNEPVPGVAGGLVFQDFNAVPQVNDAGLTALRVRLTTGRDSIMLRTAAGAYTVVATEGVVAPGATQEYGVLFTPDLNNAGEIAYGALLDLTSDDGVVYATSGGAAQLVARESQAVPSTPGFFGTLGTPDIGDGGAVAFTATLKLDFTNIDTDNDSVVCTTHGGTLKTIAWEGSPVGSTGQVFGEVALDDALTNATGDVAFVGSDDTGPNLYYWDAVLDTTYLIVDGGTPFDVGGGDLRTPTQIFLDTQLSDRSTGLSDARAVAFRMIFSDGSQGVFLAGLGGEENTCVADVNTKNVNPGDPGYGEPDGTVDGADLSYYVENWLGQVLAVADVNTKNVNPGDPGYGEPDGVVDGADLSYFVEKWLAGCP